MNMQAIFAVTSTTSRAGLNYFQVLFFTTVVFITAKMASIFLSLSAVRIHDFHIFIVKSYAS